MRWLTVRAAHPYSLQTRCLLHALELRAQDLVAAAALQNLYLMAPLAIAGRL
jgi:hypothetical protein